MSATSTLRVILTAEADGLSRVLKQGGAGIRNFQVQLQSLTSPLQSFSSQLVATAGAAFGVSKAIDVLTRSLKLAGDAEGAQVAFSTIIGDAQKAKSLLMELSQFAAQTPFELPELRDASRQLLAFGEDSQRLIDTLRRIGDVSAGISQPIGEIAEIYGKAKVQGRLFAIDIYQLSGRGIPIIQELAKQFKVSESQVRKLVETGQVGFGNLEQAFKDLTGEGGRFHNMMEAQSRTLLGKWSTFKDNITLALVDVGTLLVKTFDIKKLIDDAIGDLSRMNEFLKKNRQEIGRHANFWGEVGGAGLTGAKRSLQTTTGVIALAGAGVVNLAEGFNALSLDAFGLAENLAKTRKELEAIAKVNIDAGIWGVEGDKARPFGGVRAQMQAQVDQPLPAGRLPIAAGDMKDFLGPLNNFSLKDAFGDAGNMWEGFKNRALGAWEIIENKAQNAAMNIKRPFEDMKDLWGKLQDRAAAMFEETRTPAEQLQNKLGEIQQLLKLGLIDEVTALRAGKNAFDAMNELKGPDNKGRLAEAATAGSVEAASAINRHHAGRTGEQEQKKQTQLQTNIHAAIVDQTGKLIEALDFEVAD